MGTSRFELSGFNQKFAAKWGFGHFSQPDCKLSWIFQRELWDIHGTVFYNVLYVQVENQLGTVSGMDVFPNTRRKEHVGTHQERMTLAFLTPSIPHIFEAPFIIPDMQRITLGMKVTLFDIPPDLTKKLKITFMEGADKLIMVGAGEFVLVQNDKQELRLRHIRSGRNLKHIVLSNCIPHVWPLSLELIADVEFFDPE